MSRREMEWTEAAIAMQEAGIWVRHTDTKATVLAAGGGVIAAAVLSQADDVAGVYRGAAWASAAMSGLLAAVIVTFVGTLRQIAVTILPRIESTNPLNRFAWPNLAALPNHDRSPSYPTSAHEAWGQAAELARLAALKYRAFTSSCRWFAWFIGAAVLVVVAAFVL